MTYTAIVLAAQRRGVVDPLAKAAHGGHKCLLDISGRPMISWVLDTLLQSAEVQRVVISIEDASALDGLSGYEAARRDGRLVIEDSEDNLYASVAKALGGDHAPHCPALITTADNPLLTPAMVSHFINHIEPGIDVAVAMTNAEVMKAAYPDGQRRFYQFKDGEFSNCNLYAINTPQAVHGARIFAQGGQFGKKAIRMLRAFGLSNFLMYRLGWLSLASCAQRLSHGFNIDVQFVEMPFAEAPIDVDNERTLRIAREIMLTRIEQAAMQEASAFEEPLKTARTG